LRLDVFGSGSPRVPWDDAEAPAEIFDLEWSRQGTITIPSH
jgi:hypothetical protein